MRHNSSLLVVSKVGRISSDVTCVIALLFVPDNCELRFGTVGFRCFRSMRGVAGAVSTSIPIASTSISEDNKGVLVC